MHLNRVLLIGNLARDPEIRFAGATQTPVTELRLAVNSEHRTAKGEKKEEVLFVDVQAWSKAAENAVAVLKKGRLVAVEGRLMQDEWTDKGGERRSKIYVKSERIIYLPDRTPRVADPAPAPEPPRVADSDEIGVRS